MEFWNPDQEEKFFIDALRLTNPSQLFYITKDKRYLAYWMKKYEGVKTTLQSRNSFIGSYTEKWAVDLFKKIAVKLNGYAVPRVTCQDIGLTRQSPADLAICKTQDNEQRPENILLIIEVKMSVVWNWEFFPKTNRLQCLGDYKTHQGNPGLLRSDSMLKAIGKSINVRVSSFSSSKIPIIILGNTPITKSYYEKVDHLKRSGIVQGFWSVNPLPSSSGENLKATPGKGFYRLDNLKELTEHTLYLIQEERDFFSGMQPREKLGRFIEIAAQESTHKAKAEKFLSLLRE